MTTPLTEAELTELERLEREATAGPWEHDSDGSHSRDGRELNDYAQGPGEAFQKRRILFDTSNADEPELHHEPDEDGVTYFDPIGRANIRLACALRNAAPQLLASARRVAELEREVARLKARKFPVLMGREAKELRALGCPASVPWDFIADNAQFCEHNHGGQTPEHLAERGGLGPDEMCAVVEGRKWRKMTDEEATTRLLELLAAYNATIAARPEGGK